MSGLKKWSTFLNEAKNKRKTLTSIICVNEDDKVLVIKRSPDEGSKQGYWDLPGGHVDDEDGSIERGAVRELEEEANLICSVSDLTYLGEPHKNKYYSEYKNFLLSKIKKNKIKHVYLLRKNEDVFFREFIDDETCVHEKKLSQILQKLELNKCNFQ